MKKTCLALIAIFILYSCKNETKTIAFKTISISEPFESHIEVSYQLTDSESKIGSAIDKIITSHIITSVGLEGNFNTITDALHAFDQTYKDFKKDFPESAQVWELVIETEISYQSPEVISLGLSVYADMGGAHGNSSITLININPKTGTQYTNDELLNLNEEFTLLAKTYFLKEINSDTTENYFFGESFHLPENIGYSDDGLILLYNVYEIASYSQGYTEFVIPFDKISPYLKVN